MTDYNDGKWHSWNGGECPVHPESVIDYVWHDTNQCVAEGGKSGVTTGRRARRSVAWGQVIRFRVVKAYREPEKYAGECYAYHCTHGAPSLCWTPVDNTVKGKWTAIHIDGKIAKITWEAVE